MRVIILIIFLTILGITSCSYSNRAGYPGLKYREKKNILSSDIVGKYPFLLAPDNKDHAVGLDGYILIFVDNIPYTTNKSEIEKYVSNLVYEKILKAESFFFCEPQTPNYITLSKTNNTISAYVQFPYTVIENKGFFPVRWIDAYNKEFFGRIVIVER